MIRIADTTKCSILAFGLVYLVVIRLSAQSLSVELYQVRVVTLAGNRLRGVLDAVSNTHLYIREESQVAPEFHHAGAGVPLASVRKIVIRRLSRNRATFTGAIIGGIITGAVVVQTTRKSPFRSPVLYGVNLTLAVGGGAVAGGLLGHTIGNTSRRVIRPTGRNPEIAIENLRRQIEPFTYRYQQTILKRIRP